MAWKPTDEQMHQWENDGFFMLPNFISSEIAVEMRGVIKNELLKPEPEGRPDMAQCAWLFRPNRLTCRTANRIGQGRFQKHKIWAWFNRVDSQVTPRSICLFAGEGLGLF